MATLNAEIKKRIRPEILANEKARAAYAKFVQNIPARIMLCELELNSSNKRGITQGDKVYKYGYITERDTVFLEFYESRNQGNPTMAMYADGGSDMLTIRGSNAGRRIFMCYRFIDGRVESTVKFE